MTGTDRPWFLKPGAPRVSAWVNRQVKGAAGKVADKSRGIEAPLQVERWVQGPGFVFGLPTGWVDFSEQEMLEVAFRHPEQIRPLAAVRANQSGPYTHIIVQLTQNALRESEFRSLVPQIAAKWAQDNAPAHIVAGPSRISVGRAPAMRFEAEEIMDGQPYGFDHVVLAATTMVIACRRNRTYAVELVGPGDHHAAFLPVLDTALGTWQWA